jgi:hypothetical protein
LDFSPIRRGALRFIPGSNEHRAQDTAVGKDSQAMLVRKLANQIFAPFVAQRGPNAPQLIGPDKTLPLDLESRSNSLDEGLHERGPIVPDSKIPSIGIILIVRLTSVNKS